MRKCRRYTKDEKVRKGLYLLPELFQKIDRLAEKDKSSFNSFVIDILEKFLEEQEEAKKGGANAKVQ